MKLRARKIIRFYVEPGDSTVAQSLWQSDCLASNPEKVVTLADGEHHMLQFSSIVAARFLRASLRGAGLKMQFWKQVGGDDTLRRWRPRAVNFTDHSPGEHEDGYYGSE